MWTKYQKAILWETEHDPGTGVLLTQTHLDMKLATAMDVPDEKNNYIFLETVNAVGAFGCNGIGEPASPLGFGAFIDAINNALGLSLSERPLSPDRILKALGKA